MTHTIKREEIVELLNGNVDIKIVEALPLRYFEAAHIPGAINMPPDKIKEMAASLLPDKAAPIIVYCSNASCNNSKLAGAALRAMGYQNVREYLGGKQDWIEAGLPIKSKPSAL